MLALGTPAVMGVLNVTPDSFYDGGRYTGVDRARERASTLVEQGAAIIDLGARSYAKHVAPIDRDEELRRLIPALEAIASDGLPAVLSVDTSSWRVAQNAVDAGATLINDCSVNIDPLMYSVAARTGAALVIMHNPTALNTGTPVAYLDVVEDVAAELERAALEARRCGVDGASLVVDPGLEFGKEPRDDFALLTHFDRFVESGYPVLLAASRKRFLSDLAGGAQASALLPASLAAVALAVSAGATIVRTHDVVETVQFLRVFGPNAERAAMGTLKTWTSTSNWPKQASSSRTLTTRSNGTRSAASNASRGRI